MLVGGASVDIDNRVLSPSFGMRSKKVLKLLQYPGIHSRKFYRFKEEDVTKAKALNRHVTELVGLHSYENLNKPDVMWSYTEAKDMEATSWMDWWIFVMKSLLLKSTKDVRLVRRLSLVRARCQ